MGTYINPPNMTKEQWLDANAELLPKPEYLDEASGRYTVCLVDNGAFTAAGVMFSKQEFLRWTYRDDDPRPKLWFSAPREKVDAVSG